MSREEQIRRFWSRFSLTDLAPFLAAVFFTFLASGFLRDVQELGRFAPSYLAFTAITTGLMAVGYALAMVRNPRRWLPVVLLLQLGTEYLGRRWLGGVASEAAADVVASRIRFDATASIVMLFIGYLGFVSFIATQGLRRLRLETEVALAHEIHAALVPRVAWRGAGLEVLGASFPAHEVGGDLVDVVEVDGRLTCYLADVSGHGVPAGTLMAALKSAARMRLLGPASCGELLNDLNRVLFAIKRSNMFATAACVSVEPGRAHYGIAGHLPILHWQRATGRVVRLAEGEAALGILEGERFQTRAIELAPGDLLALVTDGLTEVMDRRERELGLERIEWVLAAHAEQPLERSFDAILEAARAHGAQQDDQTLLLLRVEPAAHAPSGVKRPSSADGP
jgi:hypothetical protein